MKKIPSVVWVALIVLLGSLYARACWEPAIRRDERARAGDRRDDSTIARLAAEQIQAEQRFTRERDSTGRVIRDLQRRVRELRIPNDWKPTALDSVSNPPDVRDSLIAALTAGRAQDSLQILFWRAQTRTYADSVVPNLRRARDSWRREASKPRHTLTDIAGGIAIGYGLARENEVAAGVGGALILVPRVVDVVARLF